MKVLIIATTCHPTAGSEAHVGWQAVSLLRREHELWVLTSRWCKEGIEQVVSSESGWENVHFIYVDEAESWGNRPSHPNRMIARIQSWTRYHAWCRLARKRAVTLSSEIDFDLAHHVTYASWRMGSPLSGLDIPWIWGPIGGGERFPWRLTSILSPVAVFFELARALSTRGSQMSPRIRSAVHDASFVLPNNPETEQLLSGLGARNERMKRLVQSFLPLEKIDRLKSVTKISPQEAGELRIVAGGNLEGRKGVAIALEALAMLKRKGIPFHYRYLGKGPELSHLQSRAQRLGLAGEVEFCDSLRGDEYIRALQEAHVYLLPSLREGVPLTQMEAMAAGCVPVVADCGGAGPMASAAGEIPIAVTTMTDMAERISVVLENHYNNSDAWEKRTRSSAFAIRREYSSDYYLREILEIYYHVAGKTAC